LAAEKVKRFKRRGRGEVKTQAARRRGFVLKQHHITPRRNPERKRKKRGGSLGGKALRE